MYKRCFISILIFLTSIVGSQPVSAQSQLAQDAYAIFEATCLNCHGPDGAFRESLLMEHSELINGGTVIPGNPNASELYKRLLGPTENGAQMPFGLPPLTPQSIDTVRRWILAGAPDWTATDSTLRRFITPREVLTSIESHLNSLSSFDRSFARYFTMTHLYNAGETPEILAEYRAALYKLVNSLSWGSGIINPQPIDPLGTIFYIDLRHYEWDRNDGWTTLEEVYPYHISFEAPAHLALRNQLGRLQTQMKTDVPSVHIDWFIATASTPPLYHDLLSLPFTDSDLETRLEVDVARNLVNAPGVRVWRAGFNNSGVSNHNRVVERHTSRYGAYWKSYDFAGSVGTQNIFTHPLAFTHDGGEVIFNLPNGLQGYFLSNASGLRLDEAPISIVSNPAASDPTVRNGISCIGCHTDGMKTFEDQVRSVIESNANPPYNKAQALRLYVEQSDMDALVEKDMEKYRAALEATGGEFGGVEPVSRFHEAFQSPIDAAYAAAVVGLRTETFLERIRQNTGLQNVGLLALDNANGSVKRDTWTSNFRDVIYALDYPRQVGEPPVITQPDVLPGGQVHFPDSNLRAAVAEALGKSPNAPITSEEMEHLESLNADNRDIHDLTGLQFAINLNRLDLSENQISDLSPLTGLIELSELNFFDNPVSDLSPLKSSKNLISLGLSRTVVSDLSPIAGLSNLRAIGFYGTNVSDLSPVAGLMQLEKIIAVNDHISDLSPVVGLINLIHLQVAGDSLSDLSPLIGLTNLESIIIGSSNISDLTPLTELINLKRLDLYRNAIQDLSPLAGLSGLSRLSLHNNEISDISPLAGLTNLEWLSVAENKISDVSPLARLTNLKWLGVYNNKISDLSPLDGLRNGTTLVWHGNPAFPTEAPKIEGPWLWVVLQNARLESGTDSLSEATRGSVTEVQVATHGATVGTPVADDVWTFRKLPVAGVHNVEEMLGFRIDDAIIYGTVSLYSPREQETTMYVGSHNEFKVWLNGTLIYESLSYHASDNYTDFLPVTLLQGKNVLLVAIRSRYNAHFGFEPGTEYAVTSGIGYAFSRSPIHIGDTFEFDVRAENVVDLAGWQFDLAFDPAVLEAKEVREGDFLKSDGGATFFQSGRIDNAAGKITGLIAGRISEGGVSGSGSILQAKFKATSEGETELALQNFLFASATEESIPAAPLEIHFTVEERLLTGDVNRDGVVNILDLLRVARQLGQRVAADSPVDVNGDGIVNIFDLTLVAQGIGGAAAPPAQGIDSTTIQMWISEARLADDGSLLFRQGIANLETLLATLIPKETALLANYPNPFNPETWIPYRLAREAEVTITIYDTKGTPVRRLALGYQEAGYYAERGKAAYWDGRNERGEAVASGIYVYQFRAGDYAASRRMVIVK